MGVPSLARQVSIRLQKNKRYVLVDVLLVIQLHSFIISISISFFLFSLLVSLD